MFKSRVISRVSQLRRGVKHNDVRLRVRGRTSRVQCVSVGAPGDGHCCAVAPRETASRVVPGVIRRPDRVISAATDAVRAPYRRSEFRANDCGGPVHSRWQRSCQSSAVPSTLWRHGTLWHACVDVRAIELMPLHRNVCVVRARWWYDFWEALTPSRMAAWLTWLTCFLSLRGNIPRGGFLAGSCLHVTHRPHVTMHTLCACYRRSPSHEPK